MLLTYLICTVGATGMLAVLGFMFLLSLGRPAWHYELLAEDVRCPQCHRPARGWLFFRARGAWRPDEHWDHERGHWCVLRYEDPVTIRLLLSWLRIVTPNHPAMRVDPHAH